METEFILCCGGPYNGLYFPISYLSSPQSMWVHIEHYKYSDDRTQIENAQAQVWHFGQDHDPWEEGMFMAAGPSLVEKLWTELDASYKKFNNDNTMKPDDVERLRGYMRGIAWSLSVFMIPRFRSADEIVMECHKRYIHSLDPESNYVTPGLGTRSNEPPPGDDKYQSSKYAETKIAPTTLKHDLSEEQIGKIKGALKAGFSVTELAKMYSVSAKVIESL